MRTKVINLRGVEKKKEVKQPTSEYMLIFKTDILNFNHIAFITLSVTHQCSLISQVHQTGFQKRMRTNVLTIRCQFNTDYNSKIKAYVSAR